MKTYFLSSQPCALTINQAFFGVTDTFERFAELSLSDNLFIQFTPQNALPISFFLTENIRFTAPEGVEVYFLKDGIALYAKHFPPSDFSLHPITQAESDEFRVTVFQQGLVQATFQVKNTFFTATLPPSFINCSIQFHNNLALLSSPLELHIFNRNGKQIFAERVSEYSIHNDELVATLPLLDSLGRVAHCTYQLSEDGCSKTSFTLSQARTHDGSLEHTAIQAELLAFAFFETILLGGDYTAMLCDTLQEKAQALKNFLGEFISVVPTENPLQCGLVKPLSPSIFEVRYFTVTLEGDKICDLQG